TTEDSILGCLSQADIIALSLTCKQLYEQVSSFNRRAYRIEKILGRWFNFRQILQFRNLQATTGMLISGSSAPQFFDRTVYEDSDLDLYVDHKHARIISQWLLSIGYRFKASTDSDIKTLEMGLNKNMPELSGGRDYFQAVAVLNFKKGRRAPIQLITTKDAPLVMVLDFDYTCVMNFITHNKAYSIYPHATFIERRSLSLHQSEHASAGILKYETRGWSNVEYLDPIEYSNPASSFAKGSRRIGDRKCWTISLSPTLIPEIDIQRDFMESNTWTL
ncbi:hypothetical protein M413DRAFT_47916, partial [Hebeloma cylindrosporum]